MNCGLKYTGAPSKEELAASPAYPAEEQRRRGPIAIIECIEQIPCNPCEASCPRHAISIGSPITNLPVLNTRLCIGCGMCVSACPGLAIYIRNYTHSDDECSISFPFEYYPLPQKGDGVNMVDRFGGVVCRGTVTRVNIASSNDKTAVITAVYPPEYFEDVVSIERIRR